MPGLEDLVGAGHASALRARPLVQRLAAGLAGVLPGGEAAWRSSVLGRSVSLTLLAGSGSRWTASLEEARREGRLSPAAAAFDPSLPRGLFPVRDLFHGSGTIPIAAYPVAATAGTGSHLIVLRGHREAIRESVLVALGLGGPSWRFATQEAPWGKPLGHGDAAWQCRALWRDADWLVTNFAGDAASRHSLEAGLLAIAALDARGLGVDLLVPAARVPRPAYPIALDKEGLPRGFGHDKLLGPGGSGHGGEGYSNVGVRVYRASALVELLEELRERWWVEGKGYAIPGNDPASGECALDNADAEFARRGRARILATCLPEELSPVKTFDDIPRFEASMARVLEEDGRIPGLP